MHPRHDDRIQCPRLQSSTLRTESLSPDDIEKCLRHLTARGVMNADKQHTKFVHAELFPAATRSAAVVLGGWCGGGHCWGSNCRLSVGSGELWTLWTGWTAWSVQRALRDG